MAAEQENTDSQVAVAQGGVADLGTHGMFATTNGVAVRVSNIRRGKN